jgi:hypothetical protein
MVDSACISMNRMLWEIVVSAQTKKSREYLKLFRDYLRGHDKNVGRNKNGEGNSVQFSMEMRKKY